MLTLYKLLLDLDKASIPSYTKLWEADLDNPILVEQWKKIWR